MPTPSATPQIAAPLPPQETTKPLNRGGGAAVGPKPNGAEGFENKWATSMLMAPCNNTGMCLLSCFCPWCCAFKQRKKLLENKMENYVCCAGIWGSCTEKTRSCTDPAPELCLCLEVFICLGCAVHGNRWLVQQRYQLENECFDVFLMWVACLCSCLACITGEDELEFLADLIFYIVIGCMLSQHDLEMKTRNFPDDGPVQQQME